MLDEILKNVTQAVQSAAKTATHFFGDVSIGIPASNSATMFTAVVGFLSLFTMLLPYIWAELTNWEQDLKKKYNAKWALVTGGSSGIGLSIARKLASQGINVVLVALPDSMICAGDPSLAGALETLGKEFPGVSFRTIGVVLGAGSYLETIAQATADLPVSLVFNNAGYMVTGFFEDSEWSRHEANISCNSTAAIALSHLFLKRMLASGLKGAITFTSSPANIIPSPFSCLYGATKAMITHFATSLACEVRADGIDVSVIHPSPVATNFYAAAHAMPTLLMFKGTAGGPDHVASVLLRGIGRNVIIDQGYYPLMWRVALRVIDFTLLAEIMPRIATTIADYKMLKDAKAQKAAAAAAPAASTSAATPAKSAVKRRKNSVAA